MLTREPILPQSTRKLVDTDKPLVSLGQRHPGLQLDKLSPVGDGKMEAQKSALVHVTKTLRDEKLLEDLLARRDDTLQSLKAQRLRMTTRGSLTLHLSRSGALENAGIALHPVYGFVYLPGSGLKGLARAWAETVWAPAQHQIEEAFGWSPGSERHKTWRPSELELRKDAAAGRLVFHDAWPVRWPRLIVDVINNHHDKYYKGQDDPGDWEDPTLVYFLAVGGGEEFEFAISDRRPANDGLLEEACGWLKEALITEGAGAKTAAGYGRFKPTEGEPSAALSPDFAKASFAIESFDLKLVTPAFLAGADQKREDCDLRPATLRGLLRWWWRTMHAAHLDRDTLKRLETAVWGDAKSGSPVRLAVDYVKGGQPEQYNKKAQQFESLPKPRSGQKVTQGLFYASYGMADDPNKENRWSRPAGSCWRLTLTARSGRFSGVPLTPQQFLEQAKAALWLLTQYGGAGSRSRKGFGSFQDIEVQGIGSKEDCFEAAARFRDSCGLEGAARSTDAPALEDALSMEQATAWNDPWYALDQTGMALQLFAKSRDAKERIALGLPRSVGRVPLKAGEIERHASPAFWSFTTGQDGKLSVRLVAFPAARLPDKAKSKKVLQRFIGSASQELKREADKPSRPITGPRRVNSLRPAQDSHKAALPKPNERVDAELLEEKTKKGGWRAKHRDSGLQGPIQDNPNVPAEAKPGQRVKLTVASVSAKEMAFRWAEPPPPKKRAARNKRPGPGRGGRR